MNVVTVGLSGHIGVRLWLSVYDGVCWCYSVFVRVSGWRRLSGSIDLSVFVVMLV